MSSSADRLGQGQLVWTNLIVPAPVRSEFVAKMAIFNWIELNLILGSRNLPRDTIVCHGSSTIALLHREE
jgi:hypothetical protein